MERAWSIPDAIRLEVGEPDFATPAHVLAAAQAAMDEGFTRYTSNAGIPELRQAVARKAAAASGRPVDPDQVIVTTGAVTAIFTTLLALVDPGDEVLAPDPAWPNAAMALHLLGARAVAYPLSVDDGFVPRVDALEALITPRTRALLINTPANPTGAVFPAEAVARLVDLCRRHDLYLISDEIYGDIVFDHPHVPARAFDEDDRVFTIGGVSKGYAMTGWRIGWVIAPPHAADLLARLQEPLTSCPNAVAQRASVAALDGPQDVVETMRRAYRGRRDQAVELLRRRGRWRYSPQGAFYLMVDIRDTGLSSTRFALTLLDEASVAVAPGSAFGAGGEGFVRVSLASPEQAVLTGLERLCDLADALAAGSGRRAAGGGAAGL
ncbi:MAG TPA: pyridoxal phosphate-dependent aminotransferase [Bacillota bacterium]